MIPPNVTPITRAEYAEQVAALEAADLSAGERFAREVSLIFGLYVTELAEEGQA